MAYRDECEALRQQKEALEGELSEARREIELLRGARLQPPRRRRRGGGLLLGTAALLGVAALSLMLLRLGLLLLLPAVVASAALLIFCLAASFVRVVAPNEALVVSGRRRAPADGEQPATRVIRGGRALQLPLIERADSLDLTVFTLSFRTSGLTCRLTGVELDIDVFAVCKIGSEPELLSRAAERLAGRPRREVSDLAGRAVEAALRTVIARYRPKPIAVDRAAIARRVANEAAVGSLGLELICLALTRVRDRQGILEKLGRRSLARARRQAQGGSR